jgi:dynein heavy chain 1
VSKLDEDLVELFFKLAEEQEKHIIFMLDESQIISVAFLERMNSLLASGEIPGLLSTNKKRELLTKFKSSTKDDEEK